MNAAVRAVVRSGLANGINVVGIYRGYNGLLNCDTVEMNLRSVSDIIHHGGTILFTARSPEFNSAEGVRQAAENCRRMGIEGLVVIGGDGSFRGALDLSKPESLYRDSGHHRQRYRMQRIHDRLRHRDEHGDGDGGPPARHH